MSLLMNSVSMLCKHIFEDATGTSQYTKAASKIRTPSFIDLACSAHKLQRYLLSDQIGKLQAKASCVVLITCSFTRIRFPRGQMLSETKLTRMPHREAALDVINVCSSFILASEKVASVSSFFCPHGENRENDFLAESAMDSGDFKELLRWTPTKRSKEFFRELSSPPVFDIRSRSEIKFSDSDPSTEISEFHMLFRIALAIEKCNARNITRLDMKFLSRLDTGIEVSVLWSLRLSRLIVYEGNYVIANGRFE